jgi:IS5 family transposase
LEISLEAVLDGIVVKRPKGEQHFCADKGYQGEPALKSITKREYIPHIRQRNEEIREKKENPDYKARRWVVEVSHSWFNRFRKILVRFEKLTDRYEALLYWRLLLLLSGKQVLLTNKFLMCYFSFDKVSSPDYWLL